MPMGEWMYRLTQGEFINAIDGMLTSRLGGLWYIIFFLVPTLMVWLKTEDMSFSVVTLLWTVALYGSFINPDGISSGTVTGFIAVGFAVLMYRALSPTK